MHLGGGDRRRIDILQGRNHLKGAQNNILRLKGSSIVSLPVLYHKNAKMAIFYGYLSKIWRVNATYFFFFRYVSST